MSEEEKDLELEEDGQAKIEYELPKYLDELRPEMKERMAALHIWSSRERFFKKKRQSMKNFLASLKRNLEQKGISFSKIYILEKLIDDCQKDIEDIEKEIDLLLSGLPIWERFCVKIKGLGIATAGPIIAGIGDIRRFHSISALRKYSGWYPRDGKAVTKSSGAKVEYSPKMKQYLFNFIEGITKAKDQHYYGLYLRFKKQILEKHPEYEGLKAEKGKRIVGIPMHIHKMAKRMVIQRFISDLFCIWRDLEGLPQTLPWVIAIGGHEHFEDPLKHPYYERESQQSIENQVLGASQSHNETQRLLASQTMDENHLSVASPK